MTAITAPNSDELRPPDIQAASSPGNRAICDAENTMNTTSPIAGSKRSKRRAAKTSMGKVAYEVAKQEKRDRQLEHERVKAESTKRLANDLATASIQDIARSRVSKT